MTLHKNKFLTTVAAAALALAVGACSSSSDDDEALVVTDPVVGGNGPPTNGNGPEQDELNELETAQADAAAAATAAMTASGEAATAAEAAMAAVANLATMQTGATAAGLAYEAHTAAGKAMAAYEHAKTASGLAADAEDVTAAVEARIMAEEASANAVMYAMTAAEKADEAETAALAELMIIDKDKNVGGTSVNADDGAKTVTTNDQTVETGLIKGENPKAEMVGAVAGQAFDAMAAAVGADVPYRQMVAARTFDIGRTLDTADDTARLMLVHSYAGSKTVKVFSLGTADPNTGTKAGFVSVNDGDDDTTDVNNVALKSEGTYYRAGADTDADLTAADVVASDAKAVEVFSYVDPNTSNNATGDKTYVVWQEETTNSTGTTTTYTRVDVLAAASDDIEDGVVDPLGVQVTAKIPDAAEYKHVHFGVWAALGAPETDGSQELSDLGIGFVQSIGDGLSGADMPNNGTAEYEGNWAAAVQAADEDGDGDISLEYGAADFVANLSKATINVDLTGLAMLEGTVDTNTFSGTTAKVGENDHGLTEDAKFTGLFSGGFYGKQAAEAGGIFDFTSEDAEDGAFRGAFGGDRKDN